MDIKIPTRPKEYDKAKVKKNDADCLTYCVLMGCKNEDAFRLFHPEYLDAEGKLTLTGRTASRQFFMYAKNREYMDSYRAVLDEFFGAARKPRTSDKGSDGISEKRKDKALKALLDQAMGLVEGGVDLDADTLKVVTDIFNKLGFIKSDEERIEPAKRYLPESCSTCAYKKFIDAHVQSGDIEVAED